MEAVKHSPEFAAEVGVPQSVGRDFAAADDAAGITKTHHGKPIPGPHVNLPVRVHNGNAVRGRALAKIEAHRRGR
jgi:hypothetical protein